MKVAYLGPKGTFTEKAASILFPKAQLVPVQPIKKVVMAVEKNIADLAVVPLENFYNGEVRETLDSLIDCCKAKIAAEKAMPIVHCLGALKNHNKITKIYSKDQALEQCSSYLYEHYPNAATIATPSTTEAISQIIRENSYDSAVIASEKAIVEAGLKLIDTNIVKNNKTRFAVISKRKTRPSGDDKTLLAIHPPMKDKPGVLYNTLGFFSSFGINLEDIKSRPDKKDSYYFYIELDGHACDRNVKMALDAIRFFLDPDKRFPDAVKILGSYKNSHWKSG